jgi:Flp pilus assembly protein TadG
VTARDRATRERNRGQATVELALCLPLLCLLLLGVLQVGVVVRDQLAVQLAAREAARAASVAADPIAAGTAAALAAAALRPLSVTIVVTGSDVTASVSYRSITDIGLIGPLVADITVTASATMQLEPP